MDDSSRIPAATYLRMSTERQQYSLVNQSDVIARYADAHGFAVVKTYSDAARTGVIFRNRKGLQSLIQDVVQGVACFKAVLVYDVSRWGRFQDTDESAHYEFLCKAAGIPVHYCAEPFSSENGLSALIMKSLKRVMAGEYSRELGVKIFNAQKRLASMGFRQGGSPGYGLRRLLVSANGTPKQLLQHGERKSLAGDRVIQIPGPPEELRWVREIYRLFIQERMSFHAIARELNRRGVEYLPGTEWDHRAVKNILTFPKYAGINQYGRFSTRLYTPKVENPRSEWAFAPAAFQAVIEPIEFEKVQEILAARTRNMSNDDVLKAIRALLHKEGRLSMSLMACTPELPSASAIRARFGSISRVYEIVGYTRDDGYTRQGRLAEIRNVRRLRQRLMEDIVNLSEGRVKIEDRGAKFRTRLQLRGGRRVAVQTSRCCLGYKGHHRWRIKNTAGDNRLITVLARLSSTNDSIIDVLVVPPLGNSQDTVDLSKEDTRLSRTIRLDDLRDFTAAVASISKSKLPPTFWSFNEKSSATASADQLRRISQFSKCEFMRRGMHQRTLNKICALSPVRPSKLAKCLKVLEECEAQRKNHSRTPVVRS